MPVAIPMAKGRERQEAGETDERRPTSVCFRNDRRGARANARLMPFASDEKMPSAPHSRKAMPMSVIVPRDSIVASIILLTVSASSGVPARPCSTMKSRAGTFAKEVGEGDDAEDHKLEEREDPEVRHAAGERERFVLEESGDRTSGDPGEPAPKGPGIEPADQALQSVHHRSRPIRTRRAA